MGILQLACFLSASAFSLVPSANAFCDENLSITGGNKVSIKDAPFIALVNDLTDEVEEKYEAVCAGSIIHKRFILTAASCIDGDKTKERSVRVATENLSGDNGALLDVVDVFCHENYDAETLTNDICLLKLDPAVPFAWLIQVALPDKDFVLEVGSQVNATGWGATQPGGVMQTELRQVTIPVLTQKCCDEMYEGFNADQICAGSRRRDFCKGDIGGPLTYNGVLVGVISGDGECGKNPGVYTRVSSYLDWIHSTINRNL